MSSVCVNKAGAKHKSVKWPVKGTSPMTTPKAWKSPWHDGRWTQQHIPELVSWQSATCIFLPPAHPQSVLYILHFLLRFLAINYLRLKTSAWSIKLYFILQLYCQDCCDPVFCQGYINIWEVCCPAKGSCDGIHRFEFFHISNILLGWMAGWGPKCGHWSRELFSQVIYWFHKNGIVRERSAPWGSPSGSVEAGAQKLLPTVPGGSGAPIHWRAQSE